MALVENAYDVAERLTRDMAGKVQGLLIDGQRVPALSGESFATINPATGEEIAQVARGGAADIDRAVAAARRAFENPAWRKMNANDRSLLLYRLADLIEQHADELAVLECLDNGKPWLFTKAVEIEGSIKTFRYFAGWPTKFGGETLPVSPRSGAHILNYTTREPVGVAGLIVPWNYPMSMAAWKIAPAVAAGCCVILKPAEQTPLTALRLGELALEAGFPAGVINVVPGFGEAGAALVEHPGVDKVAFTGSTAVGKAIVRGSAGNLKKVSLELGGKSPQVVLADADLDAAAASIASGIFFNQGQTCTAGSRLYAHASVADELLERIAAHAAAQKIGNGLDDATTFGPLISQEQWDVVNGYVNIGQQEGAQVLAGGRRPAEQVRGFFFEPTILASAGPDMRVVREEIFGPVLSALTWTDPEELVRQANDSEFGLSAGIWTNDLKTAHRMAEAVKAGTVWINCFNMVDPASPFGGFKQSGWGREHGRAAMELYSETKSVWVNLS
ncbi:MULTISPECIES: aldehyde dehydrogenase family protein [unclassified Novosphingobium]|uniref:aldehyde dehydrogenase family protein n=1 Tax=unclassified Novosphingobium TaxID=2644732 RepID=UPI000869E133|nr:MULTISPECIES: aldehyde dehydrogenase family protein [unclassified Novosphingobium]MDR6707579.1 acyl-CoA reductase-like NAD-dependent aldehyde dehydrogenase [Novosphingobium sp. 1748]ODU79074.1 MAG: betaine-aldehyde dehydrogenase [Novosphingobium sp. SCN 63-17]OJX96254.1 MAG: betaine-aldehyde dehydrogenase [Novosphingobium sp. 63-713]